MTDSPKHYLKLKPSQQVKNMMSQDYSQVQPISKGRQGAPRFRNSSQVPLDKETSPQRSRKTIGDILNSDIEQILPPKKGTLKP